MLAMVEGAAIFLRSCSARRTMMSEAGLFERQLDGANVGTIVGSRRCDTRHVQAPPWPLV